MMARNKQKLSKSIFLLVGFTLMLIYTISFLIPVAWALLTSIKHEIDFMINKFGVPGAGGHQCL